MPVSTDDPLDALLRPPPGESPEERLLRLEKEAEAKRISLAIDASIKAEKVARRKKRIVRLLLLGQSESGKSTTLRQFQRLYTPTAFREERILWRAVIQLNIVRSIRTILDAIAQTPANSPYSSPRLRARSISRTRQQPVASTSGSPPVPHHQHAPNVMALAGANRSTDYGINTQFSFGSPPSYPPPVPPQRQHRYDSTLYLDDSDTDYGNSHQRSLHHTRSIPNYDIESPESHPSHTSTVTLIQSPLEGLRARLAPLRHIESLLIRKLIQPAESDATLVFNADPIFDVDEQPSPSSSPFQYPRGRQRNSTSRNQELFIRPGLGWRGVLSRARVDCASVITNSSGQSQESSATSSLAMRDEAQEVLYSCRRDMMQLWHDPGVKETLRRRKIRLEESSGFFLDDLERVTSLRYLPSDDDVLKARLKTLGLSEYKFEMEIGAGRDAGTEWRIIDVGGSRSQRPSWVPFFDDVDAIIFLAPISGFDQVLSEDRTVNRLEDSVLLWKAVCSSKLLSNVDLILFLNKCDILDRKLRSGIRMAKYVRNYGDRPNDLDGVSKYLRGKFSAIHREYSPNPRKFYSFCTSVTDTSTTAGIIASVRDMVIRQHLKQSKLL